MKEIRRCSICGSTTKVCNTEVGLLCGKHYLQYKRHGGIQSRTKYDPNEFVIEEDLVRIFLYNKDGNKVAEALLIRMTTISSKNTNGAWIRMGM